MISDLQSFIQILKNEREITEITAEVDPYLEIAEVHRRVIQNGGPALLFKNVKGSPFPLVTNLFGTKKRVELAFGQKPSKFISQIAKAPHTLIPPNLKKLWEQRELLTTALKVGFKRSSHLNDPLVVQTPPKLTNLPLLTTWKLDGGPFVTLPLVYTEDPITKISNLGMYRIQRYDDQTTGLHCQIGKGGGYHLYRAKELGQKLPVNITIGGPPALILSAIAPLPEDVPELLFASLVMGAKLPLTKTKFGELPIISSAEFTLLGEVDPNEQRLEGPFGDHYGYYSLQHPYPVFHCKTLIHRKDAICTATVVGKPKQEDFYLGDYLQELLSPLFPLVMPTVYDLWSYGETGYHSLASAVVKSRYKREAMVSAFRILGEGQLSLTKFLFAIDKKIDLKDFKAVLIHVLERCNFETDLYIFSNLSMDTLDYNGPKVNEGSKGVMLGVGDKIRDLPKEFVNNSVRADIKRYVKDIAVFCEGCLIVESLPFVEDTKVAELIAKDPVFKDWPLIVVVDSANEVIRSTSDFLWSVFTRFEPGADIVSCDKRIERNHIAFQMPIVIDARKKPNLPDELICDEVTSELVDRRWGEYGV